jgi:hypothetical protein
MLLRKLSLLNCLLALALVTPLLGVTPKLPRALADVSIDTPGAKRIRLIDTKPGAKLRIVAILSSTCEHCEETVVALSKLERQYRARGLRVYGALVDEEAPQQLPKFVAKTRPSFPVGTMSQDNTRRVADFGIQDHPYVPILLFVDTSNIVRLQLFGDNPMMASNMEKNIGSMIEGLLKGK